MIEHILVDTVAPLIAIFHTPCGRAESGASSVCGDGDLADFHVVKGWRLVGLSTGSSGERQPAAFGENRTRRKIKSKGSTWPEPDRSDKPLWVIFYSFPQLEAPSVCALKGSWSEQCPLSLVASTQF